MLERESNVVQSVQQAMAYEFINGEFRRNPCSSRTFHISKIDCDLIVVDFLGLVASTEQLRHRSMAPQEIRFSCCCWQKYPRTKKKLPRGSRSRPAPMPAVLHAMIRTQNFSPRPGCWRLHSAAHAIRSRDSCFHQRQTASHKTQIARIQFFNSLQELLWNNLVGINVNPIQGRDPPSMYSEWLHRGSLTIDAPMATAASPPTNVAVATTNSQKLTRRSRYLLGTELLNDACQGLS